MITFIGQSYQILYTGSLNVKGGPSGRRKNLDGRSSKVIWAIGLILRTI